MSISLEEAVWALEGGYCLWVGAGLSRQVAAGHASVPLWDQITRELESRAGIVGNGSGRDFPQRLDKCLTAVGETAFRGLLRERYYTELCVDLLSQAALALEAADPVPPHLRAVAALGQLANPIVSFNIEPLSTLLLARPAGPVRLVFQRQRGSAAYTWHELTGRFQRLAYHPHGLVTTDMVMTSTQYEANSQTLAFGLAIHACFGNALAIVGMSLDDEYLRGHLERYRASIGPIYWFNSHFPPKLAAWASAHSVSTVQSSWTDFWKCWQGIPIELEPQDLSAAWYLAVSEAVEEAEGGSLSSFCRSVQDLQVLPADVDLPAAIGETGTARLVDGREPRSIELALRERLLKARVPLPTIAKTLDPA